MRNLFCWKEELIPFRVLPTWPKERKILEDVAKIGKSSKRSQIKTNQPKLVIEISAEFVTSFLSVICFMLFYLFFKIRSWISFACQVQIQSLVLVCSHVSNFG